MELLRRVWQYLTAPRFAVNISATDYYDEKIYVMAGETTKICTVSVSLDYNGQLDASKYVRPRSNYYQDENVYVTCGNERLNNGTLDLDMFVYVSVAGFYSIIPEFPAEISYVRFINAIPELPLHVKPSNTCSILLKNYENSNPIELDEFGSEFITSYRGDTVKIYVDVVEEFENKYDEDDLDFHIVSDNQSLTLVRASTHDRCTGWYVISVSFQKVGTTTIELSLQEDVHLNAHALSQKVKVITPPVSAAKSFIIQSDIDKIQERIQEAGQAIAFKLKLIDILGNAICYEESKPFVESIRIAFQDTSQVSVVDSEKSSQSTKEETSFKTNPSDVDSNACELTFTPYTAGKRLLALFLREEDKEVKKPPFSFAVKPGPLAEVQIVSHEPPATDQKILFSYSKQLRIVVVKGKDEFGNEAAMDPNKWYLDTLGGLQQEANLELTGKNVLKFKYSFDKPGLYKVDIKPKESMTKLTKVPFFEVEIIKAPLDLNKCLCECANEKPIFAGEPQSSLRIRVSLHDCIGNRYSLTADSEFKTELLSVKVNGQACDVALESCTKEGEIYMTTVFESEHVVIKDVQVTYGKPLGQKLSPVGLQPYTTDDFVRLYPNKKVICCKNVCQGMLADYVNLENINRIVLKGQKVVLESRDIKENTENKKVQLINVDLKKFELKILTEFKEIISLLVEGTHYRNQANEFDTEREKWKTKSMDAYFSNKHEEAKACSVIKEKFATLMNQSHRRASDAIFEFYNRDRPQSEIDLHGQLVADKEKMEEYKKQLLKKGDTKATDVDSIIEKEQQERDEAIRKLKERLENFDHAEQAKQDGEDWLEVIDGAGHHSARRGEQKIRPKVKEYLKKKNIKYVEANKGALLITFSEYTGRQPCVADFYCTRCKKPWTSKSSWKGFYQKCDRCDSRGFTDSKCWPFKLRSKIPERRGEKNSSFKREDHRRFCGKCIQLERDCRLDNE